MAFGTPVSPASKSVSTTGTTDSLAFTSGPTAGDLITIALAINADGVTFTTPPTLTGATFANSGSPIFTDNSTASQSVAFWLAQAGGSATTVGVTWSTVEGAGGSLSIADTPGLLSGPTVDGSVASLRASSGTSLTYTPGVTADIIFYYISTTGAITGFTGGGWSAIEVNMAGTSNGWAYQAGTLSQVTGTTDQGANDLGVIFGVELGTATNPDLNVYRIN